MAEAVASIRAQTYLDWELVLFDDGSTDQSISIAADLVNQDERIRLEISDHVGIVEALRLGCEASYGDCIARMDADDSAHPERLAKQLRYMDERPDCVLCGTLVAMTGDVGEGRRRYEQWINGVLGHDGILRELYVECPIAHPTFMMRRDAYVAVGGYQDHGWAEDYDLCMRMARSGGRLGKVREPLLEWRESEGRLSRVSERYSLAQFRALKMHYLRQGLLADGRSFHQWGAGEVGKLWLREWGEHRPQAVVDVNPRKIGRAIHGVPVIDAEALPSPGETLTLVAVGAPGARADIRNWFNPRGYVEGEDYLFVA